MFYIGIAIAVAFGIALAPYIIPLSVFGGIAALIIGAIILVIALIYWLVTEQPNLITAIFYILVSVVIAKDLYDRIKKTTWKQVADGSKKTFEAFLKWAWLVLSYAVIILVGLGAILAAVIWFVLRLN